MRRDCGTTLTASRTFAIQLPITHAVETRRSLSSIYHQAYSRIERQASPAQIVKESVWTINCVCLSFVLLNQNPCITQEEDLPSQMAWSRSSMHHERRNRCRSNSCPRGWRTLFEQQVYILENAGPRGVYTPSKWWCMACHPMPIVSHMQLIERLISPCFWPSDYPSRLYRKPR